MEWFTSSELSTRLCEILKQMFTFCHGRYHVKMFNELTNIAIQLERIHILKIVPIFLPKKRKTIKGIILNFSCLVFIITIWRIFAIYTTYIRRVLNNKKKMDLCNYFIYTKHGSLQPKTNQLYLTVCRVHGKHFDKQKQPATITHHSTQPCIQAIHIRQ